MTAGGSTYEGLTESLQADCNIAPESVELRVSPRRKVPTLTGTNSGVASNYAMHELLECPVCTSVMCPPIHQCPNGHTLCSKCQSKVRCCPICRHDLGNIRCLALEKVAESLELPCRYQIQGCQDIFPCHNRLRHEQNCRFRPYNCPYAGAECGVTGDIQCLVAHLKSDHKVDMHDGSTFNHRYVKPDPHDVENAIWMLTFLSSKVNQKQKGSTLCSSPNNNVFNCYGHQFCLHFEAFNMGMAPVYMAFIRFMGDDQDAKKFSYSLEVGGYGRKLTWQGVPRSIRDGHLRVRDSMDGLIIQRNMALFFSGGNKQELKLKVAGRIWKEQS